MLILDANLAFIVARLHDSLEPSDNAKCWATPPRKNISRGIDWCSRDKGHDGPHVNHTIGKHGKWIVRDVWFETKGTHDD